MNPPCRSTRRLLAFSNHHTVLFVVLLAGLMSLLACGTPQSSVGSSSLLVQPASVDFGTVSPGSNPVTRVVKVTNLGMVPIKLQGLSITPSTAFTVQAWSGPIILAPAHSYQVLVAFSPKVASNYSGTMLVSAVYASSVTSGTYGSNSGERLQASGFPTLHWNQKVTLQAQAQASSKNTPSISIRPSSVSLRSGQGYQFNASVTGADKSVNWTAGAGSITAQGWYTAPVVSQNTQDTVTAISGADSNSYAVAVVSISPAAPSGGISSITVSVLPGFATVQPGQSMQFTSKVTGTTVTGVTWTAALGSITSSGVYKAPSGVQTVDTISAVSVADPTKYANASVSIENSNLWTVANQQPVTGQYYPGSLLTTPLPADVDSHRAPNSSASIADIYSNSNDVRNYATSLYELPSQGSATSQVAFYYSDNSSPVYKVTGTCDGYGSAGSNAGAPTNPAYQPQGKYFHLTSNAIPPNTTNDSFVLFWDQSTDIDSTPGGRILAYWKPHTNLPNCTCGTKSCADATSSCQISGALGDGWNRYCELGFPGSGQETIVYNSSATSQDRASGGYSSAKVAAGVGLLRDEEIINATVNHALILNENCVDPPSVVFPASGDGAKLCTYPGNDGNHPHVGSLIYIDSAYDCDALPHWQRGVCHAMQTYGGYISDTGSNNPGGSFVIVRTEGGMGYSVAGITWPFLNYIKGQSGNNLTLRYGDSAVVGANMPFFNMPGVQNHLHVADPCVAKAMAGMTVAQGACP